MDCLNVARILPNSPRKTRGQIQVIVISMSFNYFMLLMKIYVVLILCRLARRQYININVQIIFS